MMKNIDNPELYPSNLPTDNFVRLAPAEKAFVNAYLATLGQSAKAAGKLIVEVLNDSRFAVTEERASRMLSQPHIKAAIAERARAMSEEFEADANGLLRSISAIAGANMANYVHFDSEGLPYYDFRGVTHDQMSAISELTVETYTDGKGENAREVKRVKLKLHDKQVAQEKLMRFLQLYAPERLDINVKTTNVNITADLTQEQLADLYRKRIAE